MNIKSHHGRKEGGVREDGSCDGICLSKGVVCAPECIKRANISLAKLYICKDGKMESSRKER